MDNIFNARTEQISDKLTLTVLEIGALTPELASYIDQNLVSVCAGKNATWALDDIKIQIQKLFRNKEAKNALFSLVLKIRNHVYFTTF